jgi:hypothetical protein
MSCGGGSTITDAGLRHLPVIDIGGGTSDFSLFELRLNEQSSIPDIRRVAQAAFYCCLEKHDPATSRPPRRGRGP